MSVPLCVLVHPGSFCGPVSATVSATVSGARSPNLPNLPTEPKP